MTSTIHVVVRAMSRAPELGAAAFILLVAIMTAGAFAYERKDCEQENKATLALRACSQLLDIGDLDQATRARYYRRRGDAWLHEDEPKEAAADFSHALAIEPGNVTALKGRARANTLLGKHPAAVADWSAILAQLEDGAAKEQVYLARAESELAAGKPDAALADYAVILESNPTSVKAYIGRAKVYGSLNDRDRALEALDDALRIDSQSIAAYFARGQMAESWGDTRMAIDNYLTAWKLNPRGAWEARKGLRRLGVDFP
ncbi:MAG: tetratricopeptide repeat protein [Hyphomicrobium sp.]